MNQKEIDSLYLAEEENAENEKMSYNIPEDGPAGGSRRPSGGRDYRRLSGFLVGILLGVLICVVTVRIASFRSQARTADLDRNSKIEMILDYLDYYYLGELDDELIEDALARGLMENIGDPYALYYDADEFQNLMESMEGEFAGIGVQVAINDDGFVEIYKVYEDSPALEAGLQVKDLIVEAAGVRGFEDLDELVSLVRGEPGTTVDLA